MAAFTEKELDWRCPDVSAILNHAGILSVLPAETNFLRGWLAARNYVLYTIDFGLGFAETQRHLGELLRWEEQFGYRLETRNGNLNALRDGFAFPASSGSRIALVVERPDALLDDRQWLLGFLSIAAEHSTYHLALGSRFLTILSVSSNSPLIGAEFAVSNVSPPGSLQLPKTMQSSWRRFVSRRPTRRCSRTNGSVAMLLSRSALNGGIVVQLK